jgi:hypothetical protein
MAQVVYGLWGFARGRVWVSLLCVDKLWVSQTCWVDGPCKVCSPAWRGHLHAATCQYGGCCSGVWGCLHPEQCPHVCCLLPISTATAHEWSRGWALRACLAVLHDAVSQELSAAVSIAAQSCMRRGRLYTMMQCLCLLVFHMCSAWGRHWWCYWHSISVLVDWRNF